MLGLKQFFSRAPAPLATERTRTEPMMLMPSWMQGKPQWSNWDSQKAINEGYQASPWVYACVKRRADAVASVAWRVETKRGTEWETNDRHPLNALLAEPNPEMSWAEMIDLAVSHLDLAGNSFWHKLKAGNRTKYLWPLMPHTAKVIPGTDKIIEAYQIGDAPGRRVDAGDMVHLAYTNPASLLYGQSPLQSVGKSVDVDNSAAAWQKISMQNRGVPDGVFIGPEDMTDDQFDQANERISDRYATMGNARKPWVTSGFKFVPMSLTPAEVDFIETRHLSMKEICAAYGVPSEMISGMGDSNRASSETVRKTFWLDTILPLLYKIEAGLNRDIARDYGRDVRIVYDTSNVPALQDNQAEVIEVARSLWGMGVPFNVINQRLELGLDDIEGGAVGYLPSGLLPTDFNFDMTPSATTDTATDVPVPTGKKTPIIDDIQQTALNGAQVQSLMNVAQAVADGLMPPEAARELIAVAFPMVSADQVSRIIDAMVNFKPASIATTDDLQKMIEAAYGTKNRQP